jgi:hypothetical protein
VLRVPEEMVNSCCVTNQTNDESILVDCLPGFVSVPFYFSPGVEHTAPSEISLWSESVMREGLLHANVTSSSIRLKDESMTKREFLLTSMTSNAGSSSPFLGWVLIIVAFALIEVIFACWGYRNWKKETMAAKASTQGLTLPGLESSMGTQDRTRSTHSDADTITP